MIYDILKWKQLHYYIMAQKWQFYKSTHIQTYFQRFCVFICDVDINNKNIDCLLWK